MCLPQFPISNSPMAEQKAGKLAQPGQRQNRLIYALKVRGKPSSHTELL